MGLRKAECDGEIRLSRKKLIPPPVKSGPGVISLFVGYKSIIKNLNSLSCATTERLRFSSIHITNEMTAGMDRLLGARMDGWISGSCDFSR